MRAVLLAAGLGTRLRPLTDHWPKCLMPIQGVPLLEYWLDAIRKIGFKEALVNVHFQPEIMRCFLARPKYQKWVVTSYESELQGTAGTLRTNREYLLGMQTLLVHADNWCLCDLKGFVDYHLHLRPKGTLITMMTFETDHPQSCGIVELDGEGIVRRFHEKVENPPGNLANGAVYILEPEVLDWLYSFPEYSDFSTQVLPYFMGKIATFQNSGIHRDIGVIEELNKAQFDRHDFGEVLEQDQWAIDFLQLPIHRLLSEGIIRDAG